MNSSHFRRTVSKTEPLVKAGARLASNAAEVAENSDVIFSIVGYPRDVEEVLLGSVVPAMRPGSILIDMTTSQPVLAKRISEQCKKHQLHALDAPVSGGDVGARNATLSFMVGADDATIVESVRPLLATMGRSITHCGPAGSGQHTKMVNQILIATTMIGVCEGLVYGYRAGLDLQTVIQAVGGGAAGSWSINNYGPRMIQRNFDPGFFVEHFVKDLEIALDECRRMQLCMPGLALAHQLYVALKAQGHERLGTHSLLLAFEQLNNMQIKN